MGWWRERLLLLPALAALVPLSNATEITSTFTTIVPTTTVVTSSSAVAGCTVASSLQITCSDGYYNTWGAVWQETCAASYSGGSLILSGSGLSLRACVSGCAVNSACSAAFFAGNVCYLLQGDVTITPGGPYQAAMRYAPSASPCVSTWLVTETDTVTSTGEVVYTVTPSPTPSATVTPSSTPVTPSSAPMSPSSTPSSTSLIRSFTTASSSTSSPVSSPVRSSSTRLTSTSIVSSVSSGSSSVIPSGSSSIPFSAPSSTPLSGPSITLSVLTSASAPPAPPPPPPPPSFSSFSSFSSFLSLSTSPSPSVPSASSGKSASGPNVSATQTATSATALAATTVAPSGSSPSTQSSEESSGSTPSTSTFTVTATKVYIVTSCAQTIINCPVHQQTTYLTTETITYVTAVCPEDAQATAPQATGSATAIPHTSVIQTANPQHATTQVASASSAQGTETGVPPPHMTTSTTYVTEIDVVTTCPPSVQNCPVEQRSTYTMTKTVATYTTTYMVAVVNSTQVSRSTDALVQPLAVPTLSLVHTHIPSSKPTGDANYTMPHALSSSAWKADVASSGSTQAAAYATTMNTVSGKTTYSVTTSAPGSLFTGDAPKMRHFSPLFTVVAVLSTLLFC